MYHVGDTLAPAVTVSATDDDNLTIAQLHPRLRFTGQ